MPLPLEGIKIIEWGVLLQAPYAASLLGEWGAEIIKIEPLVGEMVRGYHTFGGVSQELKGGRNLGFEHNNPSKRGIALNLKTEQARQVVYKLVDKADVFMHNQLEETAIELGMDYETLSRYNPKLIYSVANGLGLKGPDKDGPSYDTMALARAGNMMAVGEPGTPPQVALGAQADIMGATLLAYGTCLALIARDRFGIGQKVDGSLFGGAMHLLSYALLTAHLVGKEIPRQDRRKVVNPLYNHYICADGKWIIIGGLQIDRFWPNFCKIVGIEALRDDPRFQNWQGDPDKTEEIVRILDEKFATKPREEWMSLLKSIRMAYAPVQTVSEVLTDPQALENEYIVPIDHPVLGRILTSKCPVHLSKTPARNKSAAPELGEHTEEVLLELGYDWDEILKLKEENAI
ncbi:MAG: CoA transferase [Chloroflexota bacterium]|nr:MAG: CoA transferase [Chloroflexota bacterium]